MSQRPFDIAIVGGGLAGTCLAIHLLQQQKKVLLIDEPGLSLSSKIAAGIYNPVVFKRTTLAWRAAEMVETCRAFYGLAEAFTHTRFHYELPFYRFFSGYEEQNEWMMRSGQELFRPFLSDQLEQAQAPFTGPYGRAMVRGAGWLNTQVFIETIRQQLVGEKGEWLQQKFDPAQLQQAEGRYNYGGHTFEKIVFCEGHLVTKNPWFGFIRLFPVKGEVLELETDALPPLHLYNGAAYMLVMPDGRVKLGSTYDWENLNDVPTEKGRTELLEKLSGFYQGKVVVKDHGAGVRPAGHDRRPILGAHPHEQNMYVLNGLGAKGVSLAPWCVHQLYACMYEGKMPDKEVSVQRYIK